MLEIKLSVNQIEFMKHAIGLDNRRVKIKRGKYEAYRNYFTTSEHCDNYRDWEELFTLGLAKKYEQTKSIEYIRYSVSEKGFDLLSKIFGAKITEGN